MKKLTVKLLILILLSLSLMSCKPKKFDNSAQLKILCSYFPVYDWTRSITGGLEKESSTSLLIKNGLDMHCYKPEQMDYNQITQANLLIYTGSPSEIWITQALKDNSNSTQKIISLYDVIKEATGAFPEDEHIWFSLEYAELCCNAINIALQELIPQNSEKYQLNYDDYILQLKNLDTTYKTITSSLADKPLIVCDRFPFYYLKKNYNLNFISAFPDCTKETNAPSETIDYLVQNLNTYKLNSVIVIDDSDKKIAREVIRRAKKPSCDIYTLNSLQCISLQESMSGTNYIDAMLSNLEIIKK